LRRADHSSRGVLPSVLRRCVWSRNIKNGCSIYIYDISHLRVKLRTKSCFFFCGTHLAVKLWIGVPCQSTSDSSVEERIQQKGRVRPLCLPDHLKRMAPLYSCLSFQVESEHTYTHTHTLTGERGKKGNSNYCGAPSLIIPPPYSSLFHVASLPLYM